MSVKRFARDHKGIGYRGVEDRERTIEGSITKGDQKWILRGYPKFNHMLGSHKYGDQFQITVWAKAGSTVQKSRVNYATKWDTIELFFEADVWKDLLREYFKYVKEHPELLS